MFFSKNRARILPELSPQKAGYFSPGGASGTFVAN